MITEPKRPGRTSPSRLADVSEICDKYQRQLVIEQKDLKKALPQSNPSGESVIIGR